MDSRLLREQNTVEAMIKLHCKNNHKTSEVPCSKCSLLIDYALKKVQMCKFGAAKPVCGRCKVHCYKPEMREEIKNVMRTTGAKLMFRHPVMSFFHLVDAVKYK